jgi:hypothetical protein
MGNLATTVRDPLFWFHHSNVDRLWLAWQLAHPGADPPGLDTLLTGIPGGGNWRVADVLDTRVLGYGYSRTLRTWNEIPLTAGRVFNLEFDLPFDHGRFELRVSNLWVAKDGISPFSLNFALAPGGERVGLLSLFGAHPHAAHGRHPGGPLGGRISLTSLRNLPQVGPFTVQVTCPRADKHDLAATATVTIGSAQLVWVDEFD